MNELGERIAVVKEAWDWLRTPWHDRARVKGVGVDCAQLPAAVYEATGHIPHIEPIYNRQWALNQNKELYLEWVLQFAHEIEPALKDIGDLGVWKFGRTYSHGAILISETSIIHAAMAVGVNRDEIDRQEDLRTRPVRWFSVWGTSR